MSVAARALADAAKFVDPDTLPGSVAATFNPVVSGGASATVNVNFAKPHGTSLDQYHPTENPGPVAVGTEDDLEGARNGDTLTIDGTLYYIREVAPGGEGLVVLTLSLA